MAESAIFCRERGIITQKSIAIVEAKSVVEAIRSESYDHSEIQMIIGRHGHLFQLNSTASLLWELLEHPRSLDDLVAAVSNLFFEGRDNIRNSIENIVYDFDQENLTRAC